MKRLCTHLEKYLNITENLTSSYSGTDASSRKKAAAEKLPHFLSANWHPLLLAEGHAVGALIHGGVALVGADHDLVQRAVVLTLAMMCALTDGTLNGLVGVLVHDNCLL